MRTFSGHPVLEQSPIVTAKHHRPKERSVGHVVMSIRPNLFTGRPFWRCHGLFLAFALDVRVLTCDIDA